MEDTCTPINYHGTFSWNDLMSCEDADGRKLVDVDDDGTLITVAGTVYVNLVSPHVMDSADSGFYRVYPLVQQDWQLSIVKQINVLSSTGTQLFIISILSIFEDDNDGSFRLVVLTQSADYIKLSEPILISTPFASPNITMITGEDACISSSRYTCGQLFEIKVNRSEFGSCPPADFSGQYEIGFTVNCAEIGSNVCAAFIDENGGDSIALEVYSNFVDNTCDPQLYTSILSGSITFFDDETFSVEHNESIPYVIGQDTIYVETEVTFPGDNYDVFDIDVVNVFVCTVPAADEGTLTNDLDQQSGTGGCLSDAIDADGLWNVIVNGVGDSEYEAQVHSESTSNIVRFSFKTFATGREKIFIHIQTELEVQSGRRRRMLLTTTAGGYDDTSTQIRHFLEGTSIGQGSSSAPFVVDDEHSGSPVWPLVCLTNIVSFYTFFL